ncbi:hypothetical protein NXS19_002965 [Fusarium pseudograminearum]|nr:hypothetical protein NXS19_002965 [Fusarium pseudograminearum]
MSKLNGTNDVNGYISDNWVPAKDCPLGNPRKLKVVCVGAGYAGLMLSYQYKYGDQSLDRFMDLKIYEKNADVGALAKPVEFNSELVSSTWDDEAGKWRLEIRQQNGSALIKDEADILINATGFLSKWNWPTIPGLDKFKGKLMHTADWDTSLDWSGKTVGIIGNGSSAVQLLPQMQRTAAKIVNLVRSPLWVSSTFVAEFTPEGKNFTYTDEEIQTFKDKPENPEQVAAFQLFKDKMEKGLNHDPYLCAKLVPTFEVGCRRLSPGDNYLEAIQKDNVTLEFDPIKEITERGITTLSKSHEFDIIVCATGFEVSFRPGWKVIGKNGASLAEQWKDAPEAYLGVMAGNMPNYFTINGPNTPLANGSLIAAMYSTVDYIARLIARCQRRILNLSKSWFKNGKVDGRVTAMYPGSVLHFQEMLQDFRTEDFNFEYTAKNRFQFMGNGLTFRETNDGDLSWYMLK